MSLLARKERVLVWLQEGQGHVDPDFVLLKGKGSFIFLPIYGLSQGIGEKYGSNELFGLSS